MKCQTGDLFISQNKRSGYVSVQAIEVDRKPNSHEINKRFIWEWVNRHGERTRNSAYVRDVEAWVNKNSALRIETECQQFRAQVIGYILPEKNWPLLTDKPSTIYKEAAAPYIRPVVGLPDYLADMEQQTVTISSHRNQIAALQAEVAQLRAALARSIRENFNAGYLIACCNIVNMHNEEGIASDILAHAGITEAEVKALDLSEYDANALAEIRKASSEDPILKGGAA